MEFLDHRLILVSLKEKGNIKKDSRFRFESSWIIEEEYEDLVKQTWKNEKSMYANWEKFKTHAIKWKKLTIQSIQGHKRHIWGRIKGI